MLPLPLAFQASIVSALTAQGHSTDAACSDDSSVVCLLAAVVTTNSLKSITCLQSEVYNVKTKQASLAGNILVTTLQVAEGHWWLLVCLRVDEEHVPR